MCDLSQRGSLAAAARLGPLLKTSYDEKIALKCSWSQSAAERIQSCRKHIKSNIIEVNNLR